MASHKTSLQLESKNLAADRLANAVNTAAAAIAESNLQEGIPSNLEILSGRETADLISPTKKTKTLG